MVGWLSPWAVSLGAATRLQVPVNGRRGAGLELGRGGRSSRLGVAPSRSIFKNCAASQQCRVQKLSGHTGSSTMFPRRTEDKDNDKGRG